MRIFGKMNSFHYPLKWKLADGKFSFGNGTDDLFRFENLTGSVEINGEWFFLEEAEKVLSDPPDGFDVQEEFIFRNGVRWIWRAKGDEEKVELTVILRNESAAPVKIGKCNVLHGCAKRGFRAGLGGRPENVLQFCWIPWYTTIRHIREEKGESIFYKKHDPEKTQSRMLCHLSDRETGRTLLISFITLGRMGSDHTMKWDNVRDDVGEYAAACYASCDLKPGRELVMETLRAEYFRNPYQALESWADDVNRRYAPDFSGTYSVILGTGWDQCVWEDRFREVMDFCDTKMAGFGLKCIYGNNHHTMLDSLPGHWLRFKKRADGGSYEDLYREAAGRGWRFKFWFSPFWFFGEAEETLEENRDNLFKAPDGKPFSSDWTGGWELSTKYAHHTLHQYYLDGTHPKTAEYLKKVFSLYRELGVRGYMLDFLSPKFGAGCFDDTLLYNEVIAKTFRALREAAGNDTHFQTAVGSDPSYIGLTNSARVTRDFGESRPAYPFSNWQNATYCMHDHHFANIDSFMQNASAVWFTNYKTYVNDLNNLKIDKPVPLEFARMTLSMFGLSSDSPVSLSDYLPGMDPERLRMIKMILPRTKGIPVPVDLFDRPTCEGGCHILKKPVKTSWDEYMLALVFNSQPDSPDFHAELDFAKLGLDPDKSYRVFEFWNGEYLGTFKNSFEVSIPAGICRLYRICEARPYPWILGTDMHIEQGNAELRGVNWNPETRTLSGTAVRPQGESGRIYFTIPRHLYLADRTHIMTMKEVIDMQTVAALPINFDDAGCKDFELKFKVKDNDLLAHQGWFDFTTESGWLEYLKTHPLPKNRVID